MLRADKLAGFTVPVPEAGRYVDKKVREQVLRRVGLILGFVMLLGVGSVWAVANVQYFDLMERGTATGEGHAPGDAAADQEALKLVAQRR